MESLVLSYAMKANFPEDLLCIFFEKQFCGQGSLDLEWPF